MFSGSSLGVCRGLSLRSRVLWRRAWAAALSCRAISSARFGGGVAGRVGVGDRFC